MGIQYRLFNHISQTWLELYKGPFFILSYAWDAEFNFSNADLALKLYDGWGWTGLKCPELALQYGVYALWLSAHLDGFSKTGRWPIGPQQLPRQATEICRETDTNFVELSRSYICVGDRLMSDPKIKNFQDLLSWYSLEELEIFQNLSKEVQ